MSGIQRFLTRREKQRRYGKQDKELSGVLLGPQFRGFFASANATSAYDKDEEKKLKNLERRIASLGISGLKPEHYLYALRSKCAQGDEDKAFEMLLILEDSIEGIIRGYAPSTKLLGAENRNGVTCYLDALLFAMFARLDCFEAILYKSFNDEPRRKLSIILRLWVNLLRSGKLITTDITEHLQKSLSECGWPEAAELRQQDASEAFTFITEKLELPLLTLKMDIYHTGKEDAVDDHKFVNERLLEVAIPPEHPDGSAITLEDCLESYFNNKIEVKRYLERRHTIGSVRSFDSTAKETSVHVETVEVGSSASSPIHTGSPRVDEGRPLSPAVDTNLLQNSPLRRASIVQERFIPDKDGQNGESGEGSTTPHRSRQRKGSYRKEVMMPAWQFFSLIPWYTDNTPTNDAQVAAHFSLKRPILGMCLKRYSVLPNGKAIRLNTYIDVPIEIGLPHFIQDDKMDDNGPLYGNFKLSLQSVVCHRGDSVDSGHYIALVRGTSSNAAQQASGSLDSNATLGPDASEQWMRFDDLAPERITLVDIEQALREESPYLLFYQIVPIDEEGEEIQNRASYTEAEEDVDGPVAVYVSSAACTDDDPPETSAPGSARLSFEITRPDTEESRQSQRRQSVSFSDALRNSSHEDNSGNLQVNSAARSDQSTPKERGRGSFSLSRRTSRGLKSRSRSGGEEQGSENRLSAAFSRFANLRLSREKLPSDSNSAIEDGDEPTKGGGSLGDDNTADITPSMTENEGKRTNGRTTKPRNGKRTERFARVRRGKQPERECIVM